MARKRPNGAGTIYQRKDGRYTARTYVTTPTGERKRKDIYGDTWDEVNEELQKVQAKERAGIPQPTGAQLIGPLMDFWLEEVVKVSKRPTTYVLYELMTRLYIKPKFGKKDIKRLNVAQCQKFFNERIAAGDGKSKVRNMRIAFSSFFTWATRAEIVGRNVVRLVELNFENFALNSETDEGDDEEVHEEPYSPEEVRTFLKAAQGDQLYPAFVMIFYYGLRRGESLGVAWKRVDWDADEIFVRKQVQRAGNALYVSDVKSRAGRRPLTLLQVVRDALMDHQKLQAQWKEKAGDKWKNTGLVITTRYGGKVEPRNLNRSFERIRKKAGLRHQTPHSARHACASLLGELGEDPRTVMEILGHAKMPVTVEIYQRASRKARRRALLRLERKISGS